MARTLNMTKSASPLMILLISALIALALGVHAVSAGDPLYGSEFAILPPAVDSATQ